MELYRELTQANATSTVLTSSHPRLLLRPLIYKVLAEELQPQRSDGIGVVLIPRGCEVCDCGIYVTHGFVAMGFDLFLVRGRAEHCPVLMGGSFLRARVGWKLLGTRGS